MLVLQDVLQSDVSLRLLSCLFHDIQDHPPITWWDELTTFQHCQHSTSKYLLALVIFMSDHRPFWVDEARSHLVLFLVCRVCANCNIQSTTV